jgi:hypothetical protein
VEEGDHSEPYSIPVNVVPQKKVSKQFLKDIEEIYDEAKTAPDQVNLTETWKGKMTKLDKFRR